MSPSLQMEVHSSFDTLEEHRESWDEFLLNQASNIHMSYDWCRVWWDCFGKNLELSVLLFRRDGRIVGILPVFVDPLKLGPIEFRFARLLNSMYTVCVLHPPVDPQFADEIFSRSLSYLFGEKRCDAFQFGYVADTFQSLPALREATKASGIPLKITREEENFCHAVFTLPPTSEQYLRSLNSTRRREIGRRVRNLEKSHGPLRIEDYTTWEGIMGEYEPFRRLHDEFWNRKGLGGYFVDLPRSEEFNLELARSLAEKTPGRVGIQKVLAGDQVVSYEYFFRFGDCAHWHVTARRSGEDWDNLAIGIVTSFALIEYYIQKGITCIESGPGHFPYKVSMGAEERPMRSVLVVRNTSISGVKLRLLRSSHSFLKMTYYRIWYRGVTKKLLKRRGPVPQFYFRYQI